jgi:hypothetical protein
MATTANRWPIAAMPQIETVATISFVRRTVAGSTAAASSSAEQPCPSEPHTNTKNARYNVHMPTKNRRTVQPIVMGDLARLTKEELAEFIDSLNEDEFRTIATDGNDANIGYSG